MIEPRESNRLEETNPIHFNTSWTIENFDWMWIGQQQKFKLLRLPTAPPFTPSHSGFINVYFEATNGQILVKHDYISKNNFPSIFIPICNSDSIANENIKLELQSDPIIKSMLNKE